MKCIKNTFSRSKAKENILLGEVLSLTYQNSIYYLFCKSRTRTVVLT